MKRTIYMLIAMLLLAIGCTAEVVPPPEISAPSEVILNIGEEKNLGAEVLPEGNSQELSYIIMHESIKDTDSFVTVDEKGNLKATALPENPVFTVRVMSREYGLMKDIRLKLQYDPKGGVSLITPDSIIVGNSGAYSEELVVERKTENTSIYEIGETPDWISIRLIEKGKLQDRYLVEISANPEPESRNAHIGIGSSTLSIMQKGAEVWIDIPSVIEIHAGSELKLNGRLMPSSHDSRIEYYVIPAYEDIESFLTVTDGILKAHKPYSREKKLTLVSYNAEYGIRKDSEVRIMIDPLSGVDSVFPESYEHDSSLDGSFAFSVMRKTESTSFYDVGNIPAWISLESRKTEGKVDTYTYSIAVNNTGSARSAVLDIGGKSFSVSQIANASSITPTARELVTDLGSIEEIFPGTGLTVSAYIKSEPPVENDLKFQVEIEGLNPKETDRFIAISQNGEVRASSIWEGEKTVTIRIESPSYGLHAEKDIVLRLDPEAGISGVSKDSFTIDAYEDVFEFSVTRKNDSFYPYDVQVESDGDWFSIARKSSEGRVDTFRVAVSPNTGGFQRVGRIILPGFTLEVTQNGLSVGPQVPQKIVIDSISPSWNGTHLWIGNEYKVNAHVEPFGASQELVFTLESAGTGKGSGSTDRIIPEDSISSFVELDASNGIVRPILRGDSYWSPDFRLKVSTPDGSVSTVINFTIAEDNRAGIKGLSISEKTLDSFDKTRFQIEVEKNTSLSTTVSSSSRETWLSARKVGEKNEGRTEVWEVSTAPNRTSSERNGSIRFSSNRGPDVTLRVSQPGNPSPSRHTEWVYGVEPPEDGEYIRDSNVGGEYFEIYERDDIDQGWYLATKSSLSNQSQHLPDDNLCWAMSAVNLVHWWYGHNKAYVDAFADLHPSMKPAIDIRYDKNASLVKDKSNLVPIFTQRHGNTGGHSNVALLDLLFRPRNTGAGQQVGSTSGGGIIWGDYPQRQYPGWFHEVFEGHENEMVHIASANNKDDFMRLIDDALMNDKGIGLDVHYYNVKGTGGYHAINLWGITFDENGDVVELIIGDNNLNSQRMDKPNLAYLTNYLVSYSSDDRVEIWNPAPPKKDETYRAMGEVYELVLLDLGTEHWEKWAEDNNLSL